MNEILREYVRTFFDLHLRGIEADFPAAQLAAFEETSPIDVSYIREWASGAAT